jgi:hypothetical protein
VDPLDFTFLKDRYDFELQRNEQLTTALALPVGILGGLGGLLALMIRSFAFRNDPTTWDLRGHGHAGDLLVLRVHASARPRLPADV